MQSWIVAVTTEVEQNHTNLKLTVRLWNSNNCGTADSGMCS